MSESNPCMMASCGICFENYTVAVGVVKTLNDEHKSSTCRHSMCMKCSIHHSVISGCAFCPFCRQSDAFTSAFFINELTQNDFANTELQEFLQTAIRSRAAADEARLVWDNFRRMNFARLHIEGLDELDMTVPESADDIFVNPSFRDGVFTIQVAFLDSNGQRRGLRIVSHVASSGQDTASRVNQDNESE